MKSLSSIFEGATQSAKSTIFILAPSLGMVGQAKVAKILQDALSRRYDPIVIGYIPSEYEAISFSGKVVKLPWGSCIPKILVYCVRLACLIYLARKYKPVIVIGQGDSGGALAKLVSVLVPKSKYILSIHESRNASLSISLIRRLIQIFTYRSDSVHFVSAGLMFQYRDIFKQPQFVITTPASSVCCHD